MRSTAVAQVPLSPQPSSAGDRAMRASQALLLLGLGLLLKPGCWPPLPPPSTSWPSIGLHLLHVHLLTIGFHTMTHELMNQLESCGMQASMLSPCMSL